MCPHSRAVGKRIGQIRLAIERTLISPLLLRFSKTPPGHAIFRSRARLRIGFEHASIAASNQADILWLRGGGPVYGDTSSIPARPWAARSSLSIGKIGRYFEFYKSRRLHSNLGAQTPDQIYFHRSPEAGGLMRDEAGCGNAGLMERAENSRTVFRPLTQWQARIIPAGALFFIPADTPACGSQGSEDIACWPSQSSHTATSFPASTARPRAAWCRHF